MLCGCVVSFFGRLSLLHFLPGVMTDDSGLRVDDDVSGLVFFWYHISISGVGLCDTSLVVVLSSILEGLGWKRVGK